MLHDDALDTIDLISGQQRFDLGHNELLYKQSRNVVGEGEWGVVCAAFVEREEMGETEGMP